MKGKKGLVILLAMVLIIGSSFSTGFAQSGVKTIQGWFDNNIKLYNNGVQVNLQNTPIIHQKEGAAGGTTYVAIRELGELLDKTVTWDQASYSAYIVDKPGQNYQSMLMELIEKQEKIVTLEAKVAELEKELEEAKKDKVSSLYDLEKYLNDRNPSYGRVDFDISLSGSTSNMTVKIFEEKSGYYGFDSLTTSEVEKYIDNIVSDIQYEFKNADIEGYIENLNSRKVANFYVDTKGKLVFTSKGSSGSYGDIRDLEDDLNYYHGRHKNVDFVIYLTERSDSIEIYIDVDEYEWKGLTTSGQKDYLESLYKDIIYDFKGYEVYGYIYDSYFNVDLGSFDFDRWGYVKIW